MKKFPKDPGEYLPLDKVAKMLTEEFYGSGDLVELRLFKTHHAVQQAIKDEELVCLRINKKTLLLTRQDLLTYWERYRVKPTEKLDHQLTFKLTQSEKEGLDLVIKSVQTQVDPRFTAEDLFRNTVQHITSAFLQDTMAIQPSPVFKVNL